MRYHLPFLARKLEEQDAIHLGMINLKDELVLFRFARGFVQYIALFEAPLDSRKYTGSPYRTKCLALSPLRCCCHHMCRPVRCPFLVPNGHQGPFSSPLLLNISEHQQIHFFIPSLSPDSMSTQQDHKNPHHVQRHFDYDFHPHGNRGCFFERIETVREHTKPRHTLRGPPRHRLNHFSPTGYICELLKGKSHSRQSPQQPHRATPAACSQD